MPPFKPIVNRNSFTTAADRKASSRAFKPPGPASSNGTKPNSSTLSNKSPNRDVTRPIATNNTSTLAKPNSKGQETNKPMDENITSIMEIDDNPFDEDDEFGTAIDLEDVTVGTPPQVPVTAKSLPKTTSLPNDDLLRSNDDLLRESDFEMSDDEPNITTTTNNVHNQSLFGQATRLPSPSAADFYDSDDQLPPPDESAPGENEPASQDSQSSKFRSRLPSDSNHVIPSPLLTRIIYENLSDKENVKIGREGLETMGRYIDLFVKETIMRSAVAHREKRSKGSKKTKNDEEVWLDVEDLEKVVAGLILDF